MSEQASAPAPAAVTAPAAPTTQVTAAPVATPAPAAPVAPITIGEPALAPAPEAPPPGEPGAREAITYAPTGDTKLDLSLGFLGKLGFDVNDPGMVAAAQGDFSILKAQLAGLGDKARGWEQFLALGEESYGQRLKADSERAANDKKAIVDTVGGEAQWNAIQKWASDNAEPAERDAVNAALSAGGIAAKAMASYLQALYNKAPGTVVEPREVARGGGSPGAASGALSPSEYASEVSKLAAATRGSLDNSPAYKALQARRAAWRPTR